MEKTTLGCPQAQEALWVGLLSTGSSWYDVRFRKGFPWLPVLDRLSRNFAGLWEVLSDLSIGY